MKMSAFLLLFIIFIITLFIATSSAETLSDTTRIDTSKQQIIESDTSIIYTKVDVLVQSDWGDPEKTEDVMAEIIMKDGKPVKVIFKGVRHKTCEVTLMAGLTVKIYDHKAGKLLKTVKGQ
jgi:archaellum component FlaG (FlaF/FlaG flagellin family)